MPQRYVVTPAVIAIGALSCVAQGLLIVYDGHRLYALDSRAVDWTSDIEADGTYDVRLDRDKLRQGRFLKPAHRDGD